MAEAYIIFQGSVVSGLLGTFYSICWLGVSKFYHIRNRKDRNNMANKWQEKEAGVWGLSPHHSTIRMLDLAYVKYCAQ